MTTLPMKPDTAPMTDSHAETFADPMAEVFSPDMPALDIGVKEEIPDNVARRRRQHVGLVLDNSTSMGGSKIAELNVAVQALVRELAAPENRKGFQVSVAFFNSSVSRKALGECATKLTVKPARATGGTNFELALQEGSKLVEDFKKQPNLEGWADRMPVIIFMSDGQSSASQATIDLLKESAQVICVAFGDDADRSMLAKIATNGDVHMCGTKGNELRDLLADVGKTLSEKHQRNI